MWHAVGILSLPVAIIVSIFYGRLAYRDELPRGLVAVIFGATTGFGAGNMMLELSKWMMN